MLENGRICFRGNYENIAKANIWLRCEDRVFMKHAEFNATDFEELVLGTRAVKWDVLIPENGVMHVTGKAVNSILDSVPDCQSIMKKAIIE